VCLLQNADISRDSMNVFMKLAGVVLLALATYLIERESEERDKPEE